MAPIKPRTDSLIIKCFGGVNRGYIIYQLYIYTWIINKVCERAWKTAGHVHEAADLQLLWTSFGQTGIIK
jgi:hypothetical protein